LRSYAEKGQEYNVHELKMRNQGNKKVMERRIKEVSTQWSLAHPEGPEARRNFN